MPGPISPREVQKKKSAEIPDEVYEVLNGMIARAWDGHYAVVKQKEAAALIASALKITEDEVYERHLLDIEDSYRRKGWYVEYDKPGFNETYDAYFKFRKKK